MALDTVIFKLEWQALSHNNVFLFSFYSFSRETPSRFRKELIKAAMSESHVQGAVEVDTLNQLLVNIGSKERLSKDELNAILLAIGVKDKRAIPIDKMIQLM